MLLVLKNPSVTFPTNILIRPLKFNTQFSHLKTIIHNIPTLIPKFLISQRLQNSKHKISFLIQTIHKPIILNHSILIQLKKNKLKPKFPSFLQFQSWSLLPIKNPIHKIKSPLQTKHQLKFFLTTSNKNKSKRKPGLSSLKKEPSKSTIKIRNLQNQESSFSSHLKVLRNLIFPMFKFTCLD